ncbi:DUF6125 family protein [Streptomyces olivoreticuli]|uniref:DUF6125 family protein n=1 Tax=Streptomyces olivoreticuli TaxID=68246 RepID=UPI000E223FF6|nr:DUF6125 family protein [Streptomyces olivoreticuli]
MTAAPQDPAPLTATEREELLRRSWMATDGLWYYQTAQARGIDGANEANIQVVREFGRQEMRRLMRSLGITKVETAEQYRTLFSTAVDLYLGSLFEAEESVEGDVHTMNVSVCFAYKGVQKAGIDKVYHCGPGERLTGWLQAMDMPTALDPAVGLCQMAHTGSCSYRLKVILPSGG